MDYVKNSSDSNIMVTRNDSPLPTSIQGDSTEKIVILRPDNYKVTGNITSGYILHYYADCNSTLMAGQTKTCLVISEGILPLCENIVTIISGPFTVLRQQLQSLLTVMFM